MDEQLVVVLSRNYSTGLSVIRSLGKAGYTVDLVASAYREDLSKLASSSKYVRNSVEVVSRKVKDFKDEELLGRLLEYRGKQERKPVLFPTDDYTASVADEYKSILKGIFLMPEIIGGEDGSLCRAMDKMYQGDLARKSGLLTPKEWVVSLADKEIKIPDDVTYPAFCKPIESISGYKHEMARCENREELDSHLNRLRRIHADRSVLVQEFLPIDNEIDFSGLCLKDEIIIPAVIEKTQVAQYERGVTLAGRVVDRERIEPIYDNVITMLKEMGYYGMFDMEFNVVGNKLYFNEVNLRSGGPNYSYFRSGVNLPEVFVKDICGEPHEKEEEKVKEFGREFIYEKVAYDDYLNGFLTKSQLDELINRADIRLLFDEEDPGPEKFFLGTIRRKKAGIKVKKAKKWAKPKLRSAKRRALRYPQYRKANERKADSEVPRIVVAGRNYSTNLSLARSLGKAGYEVEVVRIFQTRPHRLDLMKQLRPEAYSKYVKAYYVCVSARRSRRIFNYLVSIADPERKMLLIPADDLIANIADDYYNELKDYYIMPNIEGTRGKVTEMMSKQRQKELARSFGLPVTESHVISSKGGKYEIPGDIHYPCFVKPNVSRFSTKQIMARYDSRRELDRWLREYAKIKNFEIIVEDFVEIDREYSILGLCAGGKVTAPGFFVAVHGGQEEHRGVAVSGEMLPTELGEPMYSVLVEMMKSLNYEGLFDIDLIKTKDGKIYFVEINFRFGASGAVLTGAGANLPGMYADYVYHGKEIDESINVDDNCRQFLSEKVMIEEYAKNRLSRKEMKEMLKADCVRFIYDEEDKKPYDHFKGYYKVADMMRTKNRIEEKRGAE